MQRLAAQKGGQCISPAYLGALTNLLWECERGHRWEATPSAIGSGRWCHVCQSTKLTIEEMQAIAQSRGGKCLSKQYTNSYTRLLWECSKGHCWEAQPSHIRRGNWCPKCGSEVAAKRLDITEMQAIASARGGRCLSDEYINSWTHLLWQCKEGHQWEAIPNSIRRGHWCPVCGHRRTWQERKARQASTARL